MTNEQLRQLAALRVPVARGFADPQDANIHLVGRRRAIAAVRAGVRMAVERWTLIPGVEIGGDKAMNKWIRVAAVSIFTLAAGCGGGGGGNKGGSSSTGPSGNGGTMGMGSVMQDPGGTEKMPVAPQSDFDAQGLYTGDAVDAADPNSMFFVQAVVTADGRAIIYLEDNTSDESASIPLAVIDGRLVASGDGATLSQATAFVTGTASAASTGSFQMAGENDDFDIGAQLTLAGRTIKIELSALDDYMKPSSLQAIAGSYGMGGGSDSTVTIDSAGNVIVTQDGTTGCSAMGLVTADMPSVNVYTVSKLKVMGCNDPGQNGIYVGQLSLLADSGKSFLALFAHSDSMPLFDPQFEKL